MIYDLWQVNETMLPTPLGCFMKRVQEKVNSNVNSKDFQLNYKQMFSLITCQPQVAYYDKT